MESPPLAVYIPQQSKKRVFPGSSSSYMDPDVVEISPPMSWSSKSKSLKQKEIIQHEVIDIDMVEESGDIMLIDEKVDKGKESLATFSCGHDNSAKTGSVGGFQSSKKSSAREPNNSSNLEGFSNDFSYCDDEYMDTYHDNLTYDDEYAFLQAHFDSIDIPPGVEAPIPWFPGPSHNIKNSASIYSSNYSHFPNQLDISGTDSSHPFGLPELEQSGPKSSFVSNSSLKTHMDTRCLKTHMDTRCPPQQVLVPSSWSFVESAENKNKSATSTSSTYLNSPSEKGDMKHPAPYKSGCITGFSLNNEKPAVSGSTTSYASHSQLDTMQLPPGMDVPSKGYYLRSRRKKPVGNGSITYPKFSTMDATNLLPGVVAHSGWMRSSLFVDNPYFMSDSIHNASDAVNLISEKEPYIPWVHDPANSDKSSTAAGSSAVPSESLYRTEKHGNEDDILKKFQLFKQFDIVQDHSDHYYSGKGSSLKQPSKTWAKKIQDEWRILEKDLPDTIFVRVYESRMDLLRAVIVGAEGTPYHDGLFFFDVFFPSGYPNVPPLVYYHSGGLRINPNLYNCGKVCLSLLNTWSGSQNEKWIPGVSTMLQVLVSIQALILNEQPYFNEPGYARMSGSPNGEKNSRQYNENTFILSLKTMVYTMRRPPKHFEDFVGGHFCKRAQDILVACKAYMDGAQVGCLARGGVQDVDAGDKSCSQCFKDNLASYITMLVQTFSQTGAKDCNKFLSLAEKGNSRVSSTTVPVPMPVPVPVPVPVPIPMTSNYF